MKKTRWFLIALLILTVGCQSAATSVPTVNPTAIPIPTRTPKPSATPLPFVKGTWRITGLDTPGLVSFDNAMQSYMQKNGITSGTLAVTYKGRLILAHGYTFDGNQSYTIQPESLFRIASMSKPITAVAILKLVQDKKLSLDTHITDILTFTPLAGQSVDARLKNITVTDLLYHQGGWDINELGYDPMFNDAAIAKALGVPLPISRANIITFISGVPLNFDPGTKFAYSNYGYLLLGQIIETVSKQPYETYVKQNVLNPIGAIHTQLGHSRLDGRLPGEVEYHSIFNHVTVLDGSRHQVPSPYAWNLENMAAHGGWVSNAVDLARFVASFDKPENNPILTSDSIKLMFKAPPGTSETKYYAMGWNVFILNSKDGTMNTWHTGSLPGTNTIMVRRYNGYNWVALFNARDSQADRFGDGFKKIDDFLVAAEDSVTSIPDYDLFSQLP